MIDLESKIPLNGQGISVNSTSWKQVFHYAYSLVGNRADAEDITQDAFLILFKDSESGRQIEHVSAWMRGVIRHLVYRRFRETPPDSHASLDARSEEGKQVLFDPVDPTPSAESRIIEHGMLRLSAKVVCEFSEKDRECIMMYFRGYNFLQIAAALGVSRWTARRITLKALKNFQTRMNRSQK